ncbi:MAG: DUF4249 domain-containing protein [Bacteroidetes bacterium]|nr:MAG: DUF4249 domain-containing protein [Bacteroidota bacterium]
MKTIESILKIIVVVLALLLVSCEEKIDLRVGETSERFLVVDGKITSDTTEHVVNLSLSGGFYLEDETPRVSGAKVVIYDNAGNEFLLRETIPGKYVTEGDVAGEIGVTYTLAIDYDGRTYKASSTMKRVPEIDSLSYRWDNQKGSYRILLFGQEPEGRGDNYMWHLYKNNKHVTHTVDKVQIANDEFFDGNYIKGFEVDWWAHDFDFQKGDTVTVAMHSITGEAFDFFMGVFTESTNGQMGSRPPANIPSNVSQGALGLFHASAVTRKSVVIE